MITLGHALSCAARAGDAAGSFLSALGQSIFGILGHDTSSKVFDTVSQPLKSKSADKSNNGADLNFMPLTFHEKPWHAKGIFARNGL
jgi:hypothetical protein